MRKSLKTWVTSRLFVLGITILVVSAQFSLGECRSLRSPSGTAMAACKQVDGADQSGVGMASFVVSANNSSSSRPSLRRNLASTLSSGPSKRGGGH